MTAVVSTPARAVCAINHSPQASAPTTVSRRTVAPRRASASAKFRATPPGTTCTRPGVEIPSAVGPEAVTFTSTLAPPATSTRGALIRKGVPARGCKSPRGALHCTSSYAHRPPPLLELRLREPCGREILRPLRQTPAGRLPGMRHPFRRGRQILRQLRDSAGWVGPCPGRGRARPDRRGAPGHYRPLRPAHLPRG